MYMYDHILGHCLSYRWEYLGIYATAKSAIQIHLSLFYSYITGRLCGTVAQWSECSHVMREVMGRAVCFFLPVTFGGSVWVSARAASRKGTVPSVPAWFRAYSETNLIKQGEFVTGRPCGLVAQWSECSHGLREVLGSSPGRPCAFSSPVTHIFCNVKQNKFFYKFGHFLKIK